MLDLMGIYTYLGFEKWTGDSESVVMSSPQQKQNKHFDLQIRTALPDAEGAKRRLILDPKSHNSTVGTGLGSADHHITLNFISHANLYSSFFAEMFCPYNLPSRKHECCGYSASVLIGKLPILTASPWGPSSCCGLPPAAAETLGPREALSLMNNHSGTRTLLSIQLLLYSSGRLEWRREFHRIIEKLK